MHPISDDATVEAICQLHADLALPEPVHATQAVGSPLFQTVRAACLRLGFIAIDADCIASAWEKQSERTGRFDVQAWPSDPQDFGMPPWPRSHAFAPCPQALGLYAVLPDAAWVGRMARAGVPTVQ